MVQYMYSDGRKEPITKNTLPSKAFIQIQWRNQKLYRQAKAQQIHHHQTSFATNTKGGRKKTTTIQENYESKSSLLKANKVKVGNRPHTNMISESAAVM